MAPLVKTISVGVAPMAVAIDSRAASDGIAGFMPGGVHAVRVAVLLVEIGQHRLDNARIDARGGVVVHVDDLVWIGGH